MFFLQPFTPSVAPVKRGNAAFQGLLKAIDQYTVKEQGEGALIELSNKLRAAMENVETKSEPTPGASPPERAGGGDAVVTDSDNAEIAFDDGGEDGQKKKVIHLLAFIRHTSTSCKRFITSIYCKYFCDTGYSWSFQVLHLFS